ncbi:peptidylprolyl isomerase [Pyruvatibacter mobilis]|uniref:Peptidyl-prolyl cis-trans isomerase n=1 Tax=Pyruvatibacter mobilis TaxID=1712261 RepID=A0A845QBP1_9HYPH|nr:peptidylprolyl isomerase [Pyruvatibacter mobilis]NBG95982.1 peptidylprolyl isomerase [Pyruvatibacter mobilis]GGD12791.1 peptidyl-prolyl cis-trans isomerase [Pyruvatibacter mobilis]
MRIFRTILPVLALAFAALMLARPAAAQVPFADDEENILVLELSTGTTEILMRPDLAPLHVERIKKLTREKFYDGIVFHRVIDGFMAQTGDPTGTGQGGSTYPDLQAEFTETKFRRGTIGMARTNDPNSANSQFFIMFNLARHMNNPRNPQGFYTVWGEVISGMDAVDALPKGEPPAEPGKIVSARIKADLP